MEDKYIHTFDDLIRIIDELHSEHGCPRGGEQTHESLKICLTNESQEVYDAIGNQDVENLYEELGDILLQVTLHNQIAREERVLIVDDVVDGVCRKMIYRHPRVFGGAKMNSAEEGLISWNAIKRQEKVEKP